MKSTIVQSNFFSLVLLLFSIISVNGKSETPHCRNYISKKVDSTTYTVSPFKRNSIREHKNIITAGKTDSCLEKSLAITDKFRSTTSGTWDNINNWEMYTGMMWVAATSVPTIDADSIFIRIGHTISITSSVSFDQTVIEATGVLRLAPSGIMNVNDGIGDDLTIFGQMLIDNGTTNFSTAVVFTGGTPQVAIAAAGRITVGTGAAIGRGYEAFATSGSNDWQNGAIYEHNSIATIFVTSNPVYFPNAAVGIIPIFRITKADAIAGGSGLSVNGLTEINTPLNFTGGSSKNFRNGLTFGTNTTFSNGTTNITGTNAIFASTVPVIITVNQNINISSNGLNVSAGSDIKIADASTQRFFTSGPFAIDANSIFDIGATAELRNSLSMGSLIINGTIKTSNVGGLTDPGSTNLPVTANAGSTVEYNGTTQAISSTINYYNITFSNSGTKTPNSSINVDTDGTVLITGSAVVDCSENNLASTGANNTKFTMTGGRLIVGTSGTQPNMRGTYTLSAGVIEFTGTSAKTIRTASYQNIEIPGTNVGNSGGNITLNSNGTLTVKPTGIFTINDNNIEGPIGTQTVSVENGGIFNCGNNQGFNGFAATFTDNSSLHQNIETIILGATSTVAYTRISTNSDQPITTPNATGYGNLTIAGAGTKTAPATTLNVRGNFTKTSTSAFAHNNGEIVFTGTVPQSYSSTVAPTNVTFYKLKTTNPTKIIFADSVSVAFELDMNGDKLADVNNIFTLKSTATATARLLSVTTASPFIYGLSGNFIIERYFKAKNAWRLISTAATGVETIRNTYQNGGVNIPGYGTNITGPSGTGLDAPLTQNYSMKSYDISTNTFTNVTNTNNTLFNNNGYYIFIRGDRSKNPGDVAGETTLRNKGQVQVGTKSFTVPASKVQSFGNPYPGRFNYRTTDKTGALVDAFTLWVPDYSGQYGVGAYETYTLQGGEYKNASGLIIRNNIESGEAFFVESAAASTGTLTIKETDKASGSTVVMRPGGNTATESRLRVLLYSKNGTSQDDYYSGAYVEYDAAYSNELDKNDVSQFTNSYNTVSIRQKSKELVADRHAPLQQEDTIFLKLTSMQAGNYQFSIRGENMVEQGLTAYLQDAYNSTETKFSVLTSTNIPFSVSSNAASFAADRFRIVFRRTAPLLITFTNIKAVRNADKTATVSWTVEVESDVDNYQIQHSLTGSNFTNLGNRIAGNLHSTASYSFIHTNASAVKNFYRIKSTDISGQIVYSDIASIDALYNGDGLVVFPNPVVNKVLNFGMNLAAGDYVLILYDARGSKILETKITQTPSAQMYSITLGAIPAGVYELVLSTAANELFTKRILVK